MKRVLALLLVLCWLPLVALAADKAASPALLPDSFAGWQKTQPDKHGDDPAQVDPAFPAVLKEYGFHDFETAQYTREGRKITIKAARFDNVSGAFGAFTFYRVPEMIREEIGDAAASNNTRILFYRSNVLVDATLDKVTAMSAADLRALANNLPAAFGNAATPPNLPAYLPREKMVPGTLHYILGPNALNVIHAPVTPEQVEFEKDDAELAMADYEDQGNRSTMVILSYPNQQIATQKLNSFESSMQSQPGFIAKRTFDKVLFITGNLPVSEEKGLVGSVNYEGNVSWTEQTKLAAKDNVGNLIVGVFTLIGILLIVGLIFGLTMGGTRVLFERFLPGRFHREDEDEIISLDLR